MTHVVFDLEGGGMESLVAAMARYFAGSHVQVSVVTLSGRQGRVGASIAPLVDQFHVLSPIPILSMCAPLGLAASIRRTRPNVVHLHSGAWFKGAWAARLAGAPRIVYTEHGREHHDSRTRRLVDRAAVRWTDAVVTVSDRLRTYMHERLGVPWERLFTVRNGVDVAAFAPGSEPPALREALGIPRTAAVVGSIGRLEPVKAYERIIEAVARLRSERSNERPVYAVICGDGSEREKLVARAVQLGIGEFVKFPGWVDRTADYYHLFDVFALSSRMEGASVSLLEAMACGVPVVVTDVGANAEIVGQDLAALVVPSGDEARFVRVLRDVLDSLSLSARARGHARSRVQEYYTLERMLGEYATLYAK